MKTFLSLWAAAWFLFYEWSIHTGRLRWTPTSRPGIRGMTNLRLVGLAMNAAIEHPRAAAVCLFCLGLLVVLAATAAMLLP